MNIFPRLVVAERHEDFGGEMAPSGSHDMDTLWGTVSILLATGNTEEEEEESVELPRLVTSYTQDQLSAEIVRSRPHPRY